MVYADDGAFELPYKDVSFPSIDPDISINEKPICKSSAPDRPVSQNETKITSLKLGGQENRMVLSLVSLNILYNKINKWNHK